jgi:hypothetical protein
LRHQETVLFDAVRAATDKALRDAWPKRLLEPVPDGAGTQLQWLCTPPTSKQASELDEHLAKVSFLGELGADRLAIEDLPLAGLEHFHRRVVSRKPATLLAIREPRRTLELACFLRLRLMQLTGYSPGPGRSPDRHAVARGARTGQRAATRSATTVSWPLGRFDGPDR